MALRAVVFDMDGTLLDSVPAVSTAYAETIRSLGGPPVTPAEVVDGWHVGHTEKVLAHFLGRTCGAAEVERFHAHLNPVIAELRPFPGIPELLAGLSDAGLRLGVFTSATRRVAASMLAASGLDVYFSAVVPGDEVERPKPAPDGLLLAQRRLGVPAEAAVYVGDAEVDLGCARAAGTLGVHAGWSGRAVRLAGDHPVAAHPHELVSCLPLKQAHVTAHAVTETDVDASPPGARQPRQRNV